MKNKKVLGYLILFLIVCAFATVSFFIGRPMIELASEPEKFRSLVEETEIIGQLIYMLMVLVQVIVAVIPGEPLEIAGGYSFGALEGTVLCTLAATIGSIIVFFAVRKWGILLVKALFPDKDITKLSFLKSDKRRDILFLIIFAIPGTPKDLLCYFAGLTDIKFPVWLLICSLGRLPSIVTSTVGGNAIGTKSYLFAIVAFSITVIISLAGLLIYNKICNTKRGK